MYQHAEASLFSFSPTPSHIIGWTCMLIGALLAISAMYLFRLSRKPALSRDPFRDEWWRQQIQDNGENPKSPFADMFADDLPQEHPSAPLQAIKEDTQVLGAIKNGIDNFLAKQRQEWEEFLSEWDAEYPEATVNR